jgi:NADPH:quinone reductase-like Zn-dependent oxidoreductase
MPVAGLAALQALRAADMGPGKRVLVTGASGGVRRFAVQLAADAGAHIVALSGPPRRWKACRTWGADEAIVGLDDVVEPVDIVVDNVGGATLAAAWDLLAPGGSLQSVGWASGERAREELPRGGWASCRTQKGNEFCLWCRQLLDGQPGVCDRAP